jgi:sec-independent protein translocase protein TatC
MLDEGTRGAVDSGRATLGAMISAAQRELQKVFVVSLIGLVGTIIFMRRMGWAMLKGVMTARMEPHIADQANVIVRTPFDVILLQFKLGLGVSLLIAIPMILYYGREPLRRRGVLPSVPLARWKAAGLGVLAAALFAAGVAYAYFIFFPIAFEFLTEYTLNTGFDAEYDLIKWTQFILLLTLSFGLAAELPLVMSAFSYAEILPYEFWRDNWRYAAMGIFLFGALFSPPDPFTQIMWALPLILLYLFSLRLTKIVTIAKRSSDQVDVPTVLRSGWNVLAGVAFVAGVAVYGFFTRGGIGLVNRGIELVNSGLQQVPAAYRPDPLATLSPTAGPSTDLEIAVTAVGVALLAAGVATLWLLSRALEDADQAATAAPASTGDPEDINLDILDEAGVRAAPPEAFIEMSEQEALAAAQRAMRDQDDPDKAQAILDRHDAAQALEESETEDDQPVEVGADLEDPDVETDDGGSVEETAAGMLSAFTEDEKTEEDIGGYYYDATFILESLTSKAFRLVGVFMLVLAASFIWLYQGGIRRVKETFFARMPDALQANVDIVTLHPVEALIFMIKFSTVLAIVATVPLMLYYAWPRLKERGFVRGDPRVLLVWGGTLITGIVVGSVAGFFYVSPAIISWLATDAIQANMIIAYRINNFGWLVIYTTVGIGLLAEIPVSMVLFHLGGIVSYHRMRQHWREVIVAIFALSGLLSPRGVFTMLLVALPAALAYAIGLGLLWLITLGGRRGRPEPDAPTAD